MNDESVYSGTNDDDKSDGDRDSINGRVKAVLFGVSGGGNGSVTQKDGTEIGIIGEMFVARDNGSIALAKGKNGRDELVIDIRKVENAWQIVGVREVVHAISSDNLQEIHIDSGIRGDSRVEEVVAAAIITNPYEALLI